MLAEVKKCVDNNDIRGLHYIFVDSLDVDPTFEKYKEDYNYCKNINGFFDSYVEISPIVIDKGKWNRQYWEQLKIDLMKNFAAERFEHMIDVARVVYDDKISKLLYERRQKEYGVERQHMLEQNGYGNNLIVKSAENTTNMDSIELETSKKMTELEHMSKSAMQEKKMLEKMKALELHNKEIERQMKENRAYIEASKKENEKNKNSSMSNKSLKKLQGVAIAVLSIIAIIVVVVLLKVL